MKPTDPPTPKSLVSQQLRRLATEMESVAHALRAWPLNDGAKKKAIQLYGAAKMARQWAREVVK